MASLIVLMTDFGLEDIYVGVMKGVIRRINHHVELIDLTHNIPPQSVMSGALALKNSVQYFPEGTVFLCIVDPDVGSNRLPLVVKAGGNYFVAPDNGVLSYILAQQSTYEAVRIENPAYALPVISATFHGRDIFSPAAAHLANGVPLSSFGQPVTQVVLLPMPTLHSSDTHIVGGVAHIDHFGNIITNIETLKWIDAETIQFGQAQQFRAKQARIQIGSVALVGIVRAYYEVPEGDLLAQIDSSGALEIAIYKGNAQEKLAVNVGDTVTIEWVN